jgi:hypothetical protein
MTISIDLARFEQGHAAFVEHMLKMGGEPFVNFNHPFFYKDEVKYKLKTIERADDVLCLDKWSRWRREPGRILAAVEEACSPRVDKNLLQHQYGRLKPFREAARRRRQKELESALYDFLTGSSTPSDFGGRFDHFAEFLRGRHLGCEWAFVAYLAFLKEPKRYFPVRSGRLQRLLNFYRVDVEKMKGRVTWDNYRTILDLGAILREKLLRYGTPSAIEIQSYMWVVAYLIDPKRQLPPVPPVNFADELQRRIAAAAEQERIGIAGEEFVYAEEKQRLEKAGRRDLAARVGFVAGERSGCGYDIRSFETSGTEIHVEVKTTSATQDGDFGFWLSDLERRVAETDPAWRVYRVWDIDMTPICQDIENV